MTLLKLNNYHYVLESAQIIFDTRDPDFDHCRTQPHYVLIQFEISGFDDDGSENIDDEQFSIEYADDNLVNVTVYDKHPVYKKLLAWIDANTL